MQNKFFDYSIVVLSLFSVTVSTFTIISITNLTNSHHEIQRTVNSLCEQYPQNVKNNDVFLAGYAKGIEEAEKDTTKAYEDGYHKATEDIQCPATGSVLQIQDTNEQKIIPPKK